jgi:serine/threonine-protein kinase
VIGADVGQQFGDYRIEEYIGRGGMGVVYRAEHMHLGRKVALKLLAPELAENPSFRERFVRESRLAASIDHPNVIPIYEAGEVEGNYFIAMRYVDGVDLKQVIRSSGALSVERALFYTQQIAGALDAAHSKDLVHRDVKPGNVLVAGGTDHCYLTDFGLTKAMSSNTGFTATGQFVGTTDYCAPEQIEGKPLDRRTDVYSLACVFFECLTGHPPFRRETDMATMWAHIQEPPPSISRERSELPESLDTVLATAMAKKKDDRYPTCSSFAAAAMAALETATGVSYAGSATHPKPAPAPPTEPAAPAPPVVGYTPPTTPLVSDAFTRPEVIPPPAAGAPPPPQVPYYPPAGQGWAPGPYDSQPTAVQKHKPVTAIAVIVAALLVAGGGTAAALIATKDKGSKKSQASAQPAPPPSTDAVKPPPESTPRTTPKETTPAPVTPPSTPPDDNSGSGGGDDALAAQDVAQSHWAKINNHEFSSAYNDFWSGFYYSGGKSKWVSDEQGEEIESAEATFDVADVTGDRAQVPITSLITHDIHGCKYWTGYLRMVKEGGEWKIEKSKISDSPCG